MRLTYLATPVALAFFALPSVAEEVDHYEAVPSETLSEAMENLVTYNARVEEVLARDELSASDMEEIHQYTYTMEQAVARIATSMDEIAAVLEDVHLASEGDDTEDLRGKAAAYLEQTAPLTD
ncbi:MAG: hypothetical protein LC676_17725 [Loktanella sp.]|nr:hypothetical protein [Loktanella sp.]